MALHTIESKVNRTTSMIIAGVIAAFILLLWYSAQPEDYFTWMMASDLAFFAHAFFALFLIISLKSTTKIEIDDEAGELRAGPIKFDATNIIEVLEVPSVIGDGLDVFLHLDKTSLTKPYRVTPIMTVTSSDDEKLQSVKSALSLTSRSTKRLEIFAINLRLTRAPAILVALSGILIVGLGVINFLVGLEEIPAEGGLIQQTEYLFLPTLVTLLGVFVTHYAVQRMIRPNKTASEEG